MNNTSKPVRGLLLTCAFVALLSVLLTGCDSTKDGPKVLTKKYPGAAPAQSK